MYLTGIPNSGRTFSNPTTTVLWWIRFCSIPTSGLVVRVTVTSAVASKKCFIPNPTELHVFYRRAVSGTLLQRVWPLQQVTYRVCASPPMVDDTEIGPRVPRPASFTSPATHGFSAHSFCRTPRGRRAYCIFPVESLPRWDVWNSD